MNVLYFSSDLFVGVLATSAISLLENNRHMENIHFYIVDDGISQENRDKLTEMLAKYEAEVTYIPAPDPSEIMGFPFESRYQMGHSYPRMCIGELLPESVERVLCLDSDTLVLGSLDELWNLDMDDNILAGVSDCMNLKAYRRQFRLEMGHIYCNAGMYLVDLKKWREEKIFEAICNRIREQNGNVFFFEQTLMNWSCRGRIYRLEPKYNVYTLFFAFRYNNLLRWRKPTDFYTREEVEAGVRNPVIIHFTRNFYMLSRPWVEGCDHPLTDTYMHYKRMTPWPEMSEDTRSSKAKAKYRFWHKLPQGMLAGLANVAYNYIRPNMWWKNE